jgi:hypothetical protein
LSGGQGSVHVCVCSSNAQPYNAQRDSGKISRDSSAAVLYDTRITCHAHCLQSTRPCVPSSSSFVIASVARDSKADLTGRHRCSSFCRANSEAYHQRRMHGLTRRLLPGERQRPHVAEGRNPAIRRTIGCRSAPKAQGWETEPTMRLKNTPCLRMHNTTLAGRRHER